MNTGASWPTAEQAEARVLEIQTKLHQRATDEPQHRFADLYNLVYDPAFLVIAWKRVKGNRGARTAGVDGQTAYYIAAERGEEEFLTDLRSELKARTFHPLSVRERMIPKSGGKRRRLGIPTVRDRVAQAALKLVLEPIFEADFKPCSYGFRPGRRTQDAIAEIHHFCSRSYDWVVEGDITACFDEISHTGLLDRMRQRVGDKRVLALVKAFLKAGILGEDGIERDTNTGTPQGGILSPLLSNIALSVLDDHFAMAWVTMGQTSGERQQRRLKGLATYRLIRYADDFVVLIAGTREHAQAMREEVAAVLQPMGLRLSDTKTRIVHIDEGFDFLGFRIQRQRKRGSGKRFIYTFPSKAALMAVKGKVRTLTQGTTNQSLSILLHRLTPVLRGWTTYFRHGVSKRTFSYLRAFTWRRVVGWLRHKHRRRNWKWLRRHHLPGWWPTEGQVTLFNPGAVAVTRYRYRANRIASPWATLMPRVIGSP
ncbi:MAG TPA: group II intron reverse transcriptase/maturase [Chloroflexota bacterium]|nr:group II intron reverse transcriptase/maturase [Chloroflexota bacterium]